MIFWLGLGVVLGYLYFLLKKEILELLDRFRGCVVCKMVLFWLKMKCEVFVNVLWVNFMLMGDILIMEG